MTFDLIGLPPTPAEVQLLINDPRSDIEAMEDVTDRLLASPRYGERWARHWLDVVRYAESDGFAIDSERLSLWRYRDYVIRTFNEDRPFDQFFREQIAGDELEAGDAGKIAISFYRLGPWEADNMVAEHRRQDYLNDVTSNVGSVFFGLTVGCARCHDHKFDPISQVDFYRLQAFFTPIQHTFLSAAFLPGEMNPDIQKRRDQTIAFRLDQIKELRETIREKIATAKGVAVDQIADEELNESIEARKEPVTVEEADKLKALQTESEHLHPEQRFEPRVVAIRNPNAEEKTPETFVLKNGDPFDPGDKVTPGFLSSAPTWSLELHSFAKASAETSGNRRKILADWLTSPQNPITPRVLVNRLWNYHFGTGIVATPNDFGVNGSGPSHPLLLDYLVARLQEEGWRLKPLHREMVLSRAYRASTEHHASQRCAQIDPSNRLLWRSTYRRLESETIRDTVLYVSGQLRFEKGGPGFFSSLPAGMASSHPFFKWTPSSKDQQRRRSIYMFQRRNLVVPMMETFDGADLSQSCERRSTSVTAPQALSLFNGQFVYDNSLHLANRIRENSDEDTNQIEKLFWLALSRDPTAIEVDMCLDFLQRKRKSYANQTAQQKEEDQQSTENDMTALRDLGLAILNTNEFIYLD